MHGACAAPAHAPHACADENTRAQSLAVLEADVARTEGRHELGKRVELAAGGGRGGGAAPAPPRDRGRRHQRAGAAARIGLGRVGHTPVQHCIATLLACHCVVE